MTVEQVDLDYLANSTIMETTRKKLTPAEIFARFEQMAEAKTKRQRQFEEDCRSGKIQEKLKNAKRVL